MSNGESNVLLWAGVAVAALVGVYLYTEPKASAAPPPAPVPPPGGGGSNAPAIQPMPLPKGYLDVGMDPNTDAIVKNELLTDNDAQSLTNLANVMTTKGYSNSASALSAKAFLLQQSNPDALLAAIGSAPSFVRAVFTQPDPSPVPGKPYRVALPAGLELLADRGQAQPSSFAPPVYIPFGQTIIATGNNVGAVWEVVTIANGVTMLGWANSLGLA